MSTVYIDGKEHELIASVRPAGLPFKAQDGTLVGIDYQEYDGSGKCNVRFTIEQAHALRDVLNAYLTRGPLTMTIGKAEDGKLRVELRGCQERK